MNSKNPPKNLTQTTHNLPRKQNQSPIQRFTMSGLITSSNSSSDEKQPHDHLGETHGLRDDIDEKTEVTDVKAPNVFERAKEEIEAIVEAIHTKKEPKMNQGSHSDSEKRNFLKAESESGNLDSHPGNDVKWHNSSEKSAHHHHKETHGRSDDIDENTPIDKVKGPNVFERAKEEFEALIQTFHPKKGSRDSVSSPKKHGGLRISIGKGLEKICSPKSHNQDD